MCVGFRYNIVYERLCLIFFMWFLANHLCKYLKMWWTSWIILATKKQLWYIADSIRISRKQFFCYMICISPLGYSSKYQKIPSPFSSANKINQQKNCLKCEKCLSWSNGFSTLNGICSMIFTLPTYHIRKIRIKKMQKKYRNE